jgi:hypothetical protein
MPVCTEDGVFMPPNNQSAVGKAALRQAYDAVFKVITLNVKFTLAEVVTMSPEWAFARTNSGGTNNINATKAVSAEGNQELFIFRRGRTNSGKSPVTVFPRRIRCRLLSLMTDYRKRWASRTREGSAANDAHESARGS